MRKQVINFLTEIGDKLHPCDHLAELFLFFFNKCMYRFRPRQRIGTVVAPHHHGRLRGTELQTVNDLPALVQPV